MATQDNDVQLQAYPRPALTPSSGKNSGSDSDLNYGYPVKTAISANKDLSHDQDAQYLARMGKQQVLKRNFGLLSMIGLACTIMSTWEGILVIFAIGLNNGGQAGLIYGFLLNWAGTMSTFIVMGELASMIPTAGGQYHWVHILAPKSYRNILSYVTGWLTCIGWMASVAAAGMFCSTLIQALIVQNKADFVPAGYQVTLIFWGTIMFSVFVNTCVNAALPKIEGMVLFIHIIGFFAILIPLVYLGPKGNTKEIFTTFINAGNWPTQGLSFMIGLAGNAVAFVGADGAVHMSEEIKSPRVNVPRAMIFSIFINGLMAFGILIAVLYTAGDLTAASESAVGLVGYPFIYIFTTATNSVTGASIMAALIPVTTFFSTTGAVAAASRQLWAFARDRGVPFWRTIGKINPTTKVPLAAIAVVSITPCLLSLINIGSSAALNAILSLVLAGLFSSYEIAAALLLYHRCKGNVASPNDDPSDISNPLEKLTWGPWRIKGMFGVANNIFACIYLVVITFFSFFPTASVVTPATMNWSSLLFGSVVIFSLLYYQFSARHYFVGPVVEI
ncbi:amino acid/polyamine transporter I [Tricladium varicosporioides]|nr:amino acid/polyamine transporter I [Hymenoscyphus varicosporioides]